MPQEFRTNRIVITVTDSEKARYIKACEAMNPPEKFSSHAYKKLIQEELPELERRL